MCPYLNGGEEEEGRGGGHDYPDAACCSYCCEEDLAGQTATMNQNTFGLLSHRCNSCRLDTVSELLKTLCTQTPLDHLAV